MLTRYRVLFIIAFLFLTSGSWLVVSGLSSYYSKAINNTRTVALASPIASPEPSMKVLGASAIGDEAVVTKVVDGDTIEVQINERVAKVRYIGIDTPETVDPHRPVGCFGKEASNKNKELVEGKHVLLIKDVSETDKFNRLLRYIYLKQADNQSLFINDYLVREGYAKASAYPPDVRYSDQFKQAEVVAREQKRGLWGKC